MILVIDQTNFVKFLKKAFMVAKISLEIVFDMFFNVTIQKIDDTILNTYKIVVATFAVTDRGNKIKCFEKIFMVTDDGLKKIFEMSFLTLTSRNINFLGQKL